MTRSEMDYLDSVLIGPALLFLNQYFNNFIQEYYVLWLCLVTKTISILCCCFIGILITIVMLTVMGSV